VRRGHGVLVGAAARPRHRRPSLRRRAAGPLVEEWVSPGGARALDRDPQAIFGRGRAPASRAHARALLAAYRGDTLVYIGEPDEGATGSVRFRRELRLNWTLRQAVDLPRWPHLRDTLMVYRRNAERRPHLERDRCFECKRFIATGAIGRCDWCFERRPSALALQVGKHRVEYLQEMLDALPVAQRRAVESSPNRIR
jgi:hypothetical protein